MSSICCCTVLITAFDAGCTIILGWYPVWSVIGIKFCTIASISVCWFVMWLCICCANMLAWWYLAWCIVGPRISLSSTCAAQKYDLKLSQILSPAFFAFHSPSAFSKSCVFRINDNLNSSNYALEYRICASIAFFYNCSIGQKIVIMGSAGLKEIFRHSCSFSFTSLAVTFSYVVKRYSNTVGTSSSIRLVSSLTMKSMGFPSTAVWMWCRRAFSTFLHFLYNVITSLCVSRTWTWYNAVSAGSMTNGPGKFSGTNVWGVGVIYAYSTSAKTRPR